MLQYEYARKAGLTVLGCTGWQNIAQLCVCVCARVVINDLIRSSGDFFRIYFTAYGQEAFNLPSSDSDQQSEQQQEVQRILAIQMSD